MRTTLGTHNKQRDLLMTNENNLSRRKFLGAAAGVAGVAALGSAIPGALSSATAAAGKGVGERLVPPGKLGIQQFSIRDSITRLSIARSKATGVAPTQGYLGGPNFPQDPTDLGPLVDLPGGFEETFEYLAGLGYRGFEFFQFIARTPRARAASQLRRRSAPTSTTRVSRPSARTPAASATRSPARVTACTTRPPVACLPAGRPSWTSPPRSATP